jgi:glycerate kinase
MGSLNMTDSQTILVAPCGFKGSLSAEQAAAANARGVTRAMPNARVLQVPIPDGGEGFTATLAAVTGGQLEYVDVTGPLGDPVRAPMARLGGDPGTVVVEMAAAAGLSLIPHDKRNPLYTSTYGVGQMISAALDWDAQKILLGCGDSGTSDAGSGMLSALGARLLDEEGGPVRPGARGLTDLRTIDSSGLDPRLQTVEIEAVCNITNVLCGDSGVARIFGPQKGASAADVEVIAEGLERFAALAQIHVQQFDARAPHIASMPGGGASGGLGAALVAYLGAKLRSRFDVVFDYIPFDQMLEQSDLVITAEGSIDFQTRRGKIPAEVARRAHVAGLAAVGLAGMLGDGYELSVGPDGLDAVFAVADRPMDLGTSIENGEVLLMRATEQVARLIASVWSRA